MPTGSMLGWRAKDTVTGFTGKVTAVCTHLHGPTALLLEASDGQGAPHSLWVDQVRAILVKKPETAEEVLDRIFAASTPH